MMFSLKTFILHLRDDRHRHRRLPSLFPPAVTRKPLCGFSYHRSGLKVSRPIYPTKQVQWPRNRNPFLIITSVVRYSFEFPRSHSRHKENLARQQEQMAFLCERCRLWASDTSHAFTGGRSRRCFMCMRRGCAVWRRGGEENIKAKQALNPQEWKRIGNAV